jgi:hypothetical protein
LDIHIDTESKTSVSVISSAFIFRVDVMTICCWHMYQSVKSVPHPVGVQCRRRPESNCVIPSRFWQWDGKLPQNILAHSFTMKASNLRYRKCVHGLYVLIFYSIKQLLKKTVYFSRSTTMLSFQGHKLTGISVAPTSCLHIRHAASTDCRKQENVNTKFCENQSTARKLKQGTYRRHNDLTSLLFFLNDGM